MADRVSGARRVVLEGVDHYVSMRAPDQLAREVPSFLQSVSAAA